MTVLELLAESKAAHYRAQSLRRSGDKEGAADEIKLAKVRRAAAHLADPQHEDIAWLQPMANQRTHRDMHSDLMEFYKAEEAKNAV